MRRLLRILSVIAICTTVCAVLMSGVILSGLGVGYCLHQLVPGVDLGSATVIGVLATITVVYCMLQLLRASASIKSVERSFGEDADDPVLSDEQVEYVTDQLTDAILTNLGRSKRKSGSWSRPRQQG
jgi:type VI protein secretion system component VasK